MDRNIVKKLIPQTPSPVINLIMESNTGGMFALRGIVLEVDENSLIFKTKQCTSALDYRKILQIVLTSQREL